MTPKQRIYEDYFKKSRLPDYRNLLIKANESGYRMMSAKDVFRYVRSQGSGLVLMNRHDVDTSPRVARQMFEIEKEIYGHEGTSTYYFRDSTTDIDLIHEIEDYGYETGYHFETIAYYEKKHKLKSKEKLKEKIDDLRALFLEELENYRKKTGTKSETVSAHGDWTNVHFDISGNLLLDSETRKKAKIIGTADDKVLADIFAKQYFDMQILERFASSVIRDINSSIGNIFILTHPRNWKADILFNTKDNIVRTFESLVYKFQINHQ